MANVKDPINNLATLLLPPTMVNGQFRLIKRLGAERTEQRYHTDTLARDLRDDPILFRLYDSTIADKAKGPLRALSRVPHHKYIVRPREAGTTRIPGIQNSFTIFEPFIPLTWLISYEPGRQRMLPPRFIWKLAKTAVESLACLHSSGVALVELDLDSFVLAFPDINRAHGNQLREIFHAPWTNGDIDKSSKLRRGNLRDIEHRVKFGPLENSGPTETIRNIAAKISAAPENQSDKQVGPSVNVWDIASMLAQRVCGGSKHQPFDIPAGNFHTSNNDTIYQMLKTASDAGPKTYGLAFPDHDLKVFADLLKKMLARDPKDRFTAQDARKHSFFSHERPTTGGIPLGAAQPVPGRAGSPRRVNDRPRSPRRRPRSPGRGRHGR